MLVCEHVSKSYGGKQALGDVNVRVERGEIVGLLGRNGAGKTTLMSCVAGIVRPSGGSISFDGQSLLPESAARARFGVLISPSFLDYLNVEQNLRLLMELGGRVARREIEDRVTRVLDLVGLAGERRKKVKTFSFGMKQRLGLAQAIMEDPEFLMLDEPLVGLDPPGRETFKAILRQKATREGCAVLLSTHELDAVTGLCDRIVMIEEGRVAYDGVYVHDRRVVIRTQRPVDQVLDWPDVMIEGDQITLNDPSRMDDLIVAGVFATNPIIDMTTSEADLTSLF